MNRSIQNQQANPPNGPKMTYEIFKQFWHHYTQAFYNYNLAQFGQISAHYKVPMPLPQKIKEIGDRHLKNYFDEVWDESDLKFNEVPQQKAAVPVNNMPPTARPPYNAPHNNGSKNGRLYQEPKYPNADSKFNPRQNIQQQKPAYNSNNVKTPFDTSNNARTPFDASNNARTPFDTSNMARKGTRPLYNEQDSRSPNVYNGFNPNRQTFEQRQPYPYNNQMQQRQRGQPGIRSGIRGGYQNVNRQNWCNGNPQKRSFTNLSDDESSERAFSSTNNSQSNQSDNYNKRMTKNLGFGGEDSD